MNLRKQTSENNKKHIKSNLSSDGGRVGVKFSKSLQIFNNCVILHEILYDFAQATGLIYFIESSNEKNTQAAKVRGNI